MCFDLILTINTQALLSKKRTELLLFIITTFVSLTLLCSLSLQGHK